MKLNKCIFASVAQSVVHLTRNEKVACSSQVTSSKPDQPQDWPGLLFIVYLTVYRVKIARLSPK